MTPAAVCPDCSHPCVLLLTVIDRVFGREVDRLVCVECWGKRMRED